MLVCCGSIFCVYGEAWLEFLAPPMAGKLKRLESIPHYCMLPPGVTIQVWMISNDGFSHSGIICKAVSVIIPILSVLTYFWDPKVLACLLLESPFVVSWPVTLGDMIWSDWDDAFPHEKGGKATHPLQIRVSRLQCFRRRKGVCLSRKSKMSFSWCRPDLLGMTMMLLQVVSSFMAPTCTKLHDQEPPQSQRTDFMAGCLRCWSDDWDVNVPFWSLRP